MRLVPISGLVSAALLAACTHGEADSVAARPAELRTAYEVSLTAQFPTERLTRRQTSEFLTPSGSGEIFVATFEDLPAGFFDLSDMDSEVRRTLLVGMHPTLLETGEVRYRVELSFADSGEALPFGLTAQPELLVALGETGTIHFGQDGGSVHTNFTLDLSSAPAAE